MKRTAILLAISLFVASCAMLQPRSPSLVGKAVQALGGGETLANVKTMSMKGTVRHWEPEQSMAPGGEMRFACESTFDAVADVGAHAVDRPHRLAGALVHRAAQHVDQIAHHLLGQNALRLGDEPGKHIAVVVGDARDIERRAVGADGGDGAVGGGHFEQRDRTGTERQ